MNAEPPPISTVQAMAPPALNHVVRTCLAKDPDVRWQTAHDVLVELKWIAEAGSQLELVTGRLQLGNPMVPQGLVSRACWRRPSYDLIRLRVPKHQENPPPLLTRDLQHP